MHQRHAVLLAEIATNTEVENNLISLSTSRSGLSADFLPFRQSDLNSAQQHSQNELNGGNKRKIKKTHNMLN